MGTLKTAIAKIREGYFTLKPKQSDIYLAGPNGKNRRRFRVVCAGRRSGKTFLALVELIVFALTHSGARCYYLAPTHKQAKDIAWGMLKAMLWPLEVIDGKPNESELTIRIINGASIFLRGTENRDSLRGVEMNIVVLDEYAQMREEVWDEVVRPTLATTGGPALWIGTPRGFNHFHSLFQFASKSENDSWYSWQYTTEEGGLVPLEEIEAAKRDSDPRRYRQEFLAGWEALASRIYYNFERTLHIREDVEDVQGELLVGMDFNIDPMSACLASRVSDQLHIWDEVVLMGSNTEEMATEIRGRYRGRQIHCCPDPNGRRRITSASVGVTDFNILRNFGFRIDAPSRAPLVIDRINTVCAALKDTSGITRLYIHPRCKNVIRFLEGHTYREGTKLPDKSGGLDHMADACGYLVCATYGMLLRGKTSFEVLRM